MSDRYQIGELHSAEGVDLMIYDTAVCWRTVSRRQASTTRIDRRRRWIVKECERLNMRDDDPDSAPALPYCYGLIHNPEPDGYIIISDGEKRCYRCDRDAHARRQREARARKRAAA